MAITPIAKRKMVSRFKAIAKKDQVETIESVTPKTAPQQYWNTQAKLDRVEKRRKIRAERLKRQDKFVSVADRGSRGKDHELSKTKALVGRKIMKAFTESTIEEKLDVISRLRALKRHAAFIVKTATDAGQTNLNPDQAKRMVALGDYSSKLMKKAARKTPEVARKVQMEEAPTNNVGGGNIAGINPPAGPSKKAMKFALARRRRCGCM